MEQVKSFSVTVEEVHSGDDLVAMADLGIDKLFKRVRIRLQGVDTPNAYMAKVNSVAGNLRDEVRKLTLGKKCRVNIVAEGKGGWLGTLYVLQDEGELNVNELLIDRGFVYKRNGEIVNGAPHQTHTTAV